MFEAILVLLVATSALANVIEWTPDPLCPYPSYEPIKFPVEGDCSKYYECMDGTKTLLDCPSGYYFVEAEQGCEPSYAVKCDADVHTTTYAPPDVVPPTCIATGDEILYFPYTGDCTKYWECYQGLNYIHQCPVGLYYNSLKHYCDYPANTDCSY